MNKFFIAFAVFILSVSSISALDLVIDPAQGARENMTLSLADFHLALDDSSIVAYHSFNELQGTFFPDYSSNSLHASVFSPTVSSVIFNGHAAASFPGTATGYITIPHNSQLSPQSTQGNFSISFWIFSTSSQGEDELLMFKGSNSIYVFRIYTDNRLYVYTVLNQDPTRILLINSKNLRSSGWTHIVYTLENTGSGTYRASLYENGAFLGSNANSGQLDVSTGDVFVGSVAGYTFKGMLDELTFYNRTLNQNDVSQLYAQDNRFNRQGVITFSNLNLHNDSSENLLSVFANVSVPLQGTTVFVQAGVNTSDSYLYGPSHILVQGHAKDISISESDNVSLRFLFESSLGNNTPILKDEDVFISSYEGVADEQAPSLVVHSPSLQAYSQNDFPLVLNASIDEPGEVYYSFDGGITNESMTYLGTFTKKITSLPTGSYTVSFFARDYSGNVNSSSYSFDVDTTGAIAFTNSTPQNGTIVTSQTTNLFSIPLNLSTDLPGESSVSYSLFDSRHQLINYTTRSAGIHSLKFERLKYGIYYYSASINNSLGASFSTEERMYVINRPMNFSMTLAIAPFFNSLQRNGTATYAIFGDSIEHRPNTWTYFFRNRMEAQYGNSGDGYIALAGTSSNGQAGANYLRQGYSYLVVGPCAIDSLNAGPRDANGTRAIDGIYSKIGCFDNGLSNYLQQTFYGTNVTLVYVKEPGAGIMNISINGVQRGLVDANSNTVGIASAQFLTNTTPSTLNVLRVGLTNGNVTNPRWTQLNAIIARTGTNGTSYSRMARGGIGVVDYNRALPGVIEDTLRLANPQLLILKLDGDEAGTLENYKRNVTLFGQRVRAGAPNAGIIYLSYHNTSEQWIPEMDYLINTAFSKPFAGFINFYDLLGYGDMIQRGYLDDQVHFSAAGGDFYGNYTYSTFQSGKSPYGSKR